MNIIHYGMYPSTFWNDAQTASHHAKNENLDKAIEAARKAVALEPDNHERKQELELYRTQKLNMNHDDQALAIIHEKRAEPTFKRIQTLIDAFYAQSYLEIGVFEGGTFLNLDVPFKVAVDPLFRFDPQIYANDNAHFYNTTSDDFFTQFPERSLLLEKKYHNTPFKFDIIYLDGLHTFEQTLRDFANSLPFSHEKTVWIFDDTVPSNCFAAMPCVKKQDTLKDYAGLFADSAWQGDVFKAIFAIHDMYPDFSYCTQTDNGNAQTILWRTEKTTKRTKVFESIEAISRMRYEDFIEYAWILKPMHDQDIFPLIYTNIDPLTHKTGDEARLVIQKIKTIELLQNIHDHTKDILLPQLEQLREANNALSVENHVLKKLLEKRA